MGIVHGGRRPIVRTQGCGPWNASAILVDLPNAPVAQCRATHL